MRVAVPIVLLFVLQNYLILQGAAIAGKFVAPFLILAVSAIILVIYFWQLLRPGKSEALPGKTINRMITAATGMLSTAALYPTLRNMIQSVADPAQGSDVIPQLVALYERNSRGIQPYFPLEQFAWHPFPVYMPLHWLPLGIGYMLHMDIRWVGVLFLFVAAGIYGYKIAGARLVENILAAMLPAVALYCFVHWATYDMAVTYEILIAAYYLLLAAGLAGRSIPLIAAGIIACVLSRYTMVFWLPLFALLLWQHRSKKENVILWAIVAASVLALYVVPFYLRDPSILKAGIKYHNMCYVTDWDGFGHPEQTTAFDKGLNFSWYTREALSGSMEHRLKIARVIQALLMLLILIAGVFLYRRWKHKISYMDCCLGALYAVVVVFFLSSPHTYIYYYLPFCMVSAVVCGRVVVLNSQNRAKAI